MTALDERTDRARQLLDDIEAALATLAKLAQGVDPDIATDADLVLLDNVLDKLYRTEDAWSRANRMLDRMDADVDAQDQAETQSDVRYGGAL